MRNPLTHVEPLFASGAKCAHSRLILSARALGASQLICKLLVITCVLLASHVVVLAQSTPDTFALPVNADTGGYRKFDSKAVTGKFHTGDDYYSRDLKVLATNCGVVVKKILNGKSDHGFGNALIIRHDLSSGPVYSLYGHLASFAPGIAENSTVTRRQIIGTMGKTGSGSNNIVHLHFELKSSAILGNPAAFGSTRADTVWGYVPIKSGTSVAASASSYGYIRPSSFYGGKVAQCPTKSGRTMLASTNERKGTILKRLTGDNGQKIPLILVHGIHGSDDIDDIMEDNERDQEYWGAFISTFSRNPLLTDSFTLYMFQYYSDVEGVQDLASHMGSYIDAKLADRPHVLLAHSMGGLVSKSYMVDYRHRGGKWSGSSGGDTTLLLITLATPHHGTPAANDAEALKKYMGTGWYQFFSVANFVYWVMADHGISNPSLNSGTYNRSDLRWDNYDGAIENDLNLWLGPANNRSSRYSSKVIAYAGVLKNATILTGAAALIEARLHILTDHRKLELLNGTLVYGLSRKFGGTDGMVPYDSALLCDKGPFLIDASNTSFVCSSPTRVRRFEPGTASILTSSGNTLSINRRSRGYDHLDMKDHEHILSWVVKDLLAIRPRPVVSTSLKLSAPNGAYRVGEPISGTFSVANRGGSNVVMNRTLIGGRLAGGGDRPYDFGPVPSSIILRPGDVIHYSGSFTPSAGGTYTFAVAYEDQNGKWTMPVEAENNNVNKVNITVQTVAARVVVSKSLTLIPGTGPYSIGQTVTGSFGITNRGSAPLTMRQVLIGGRVGDNCPNNICPDFTINPNITLNPGQTYNYSGQIKLSQAGTYTFYVAYQTPDEKWEMPVKPENGTVNKLSILVQGPTPTLTRAAPSSVIASPNAQTITIYGTRLAKVIYGELKLPNGTTTYLYLPLSQLFRVTDDQTRITTKFLYHGTYYVTVWTAEGRSNQFPIVVY